MCGNLWMVAQLSGRTPREALMDLRNHYGCGEFTTSTLCERYASAQCRITSRMWAPLYRGWQNPRVQAPSFSIPRTQFMRRRKMNAFNLTK